MDRKEVGELLALCANFDQRTVGQGDIEAWVAVASATGWTWPLAQRAVIEYHLRGGDKPRIRPANITDALDKIRERVRRTVLHTDLVPPRELADDPRAEIAWRRDTAARLTQQALDAWADGHPLPQIEAADLQTASSPPRRVAELVGDAFTMPAPPRPDEVAAAAGRHLTEKRRRREAARAELDDLRARATPPPDPPAPPPAGTEEEEADHA